jgi:hypothetical protein
MTFYFLLRTWGRRYTVFVILMALVIGISVAPIVRAAPHGVTYRGAPVTTAVPGKPFTVSFRVTNTSAETYSGVNVIFHIPDRLTHSKVSPAHAELADDLVIWRNLTMTGGQSFTPSFTFTVDSGTLLKTKLPIWVEVTGTDMEATSTNFSVTTKAATASINSALTSIDIKNLFQGVYGRMPSSSELTYWLGRRADKPGRTALTGAMGYHKANNIVH